MKLIDVGCFNGDSCLSLVSTPEVSEIYAFDPNPDYRQLWDAIHSFYPNIHFVQAAVSNKNGLVDYTKRPTELPLGSTITKDKRDWGNGEIIQVKCLDIAELINEDVWLKLDAEGEEFVILERLIETDKLHHVKRIYLEWHTRKMTKDYTSRESAIHEALEKANVQVRNW